MSVMDPIWKAKLEIIKTIIAGHDILHKSLEKNLLKILNLRTIVLVRISFYGFESACEMLYICIPTPLSIFYYSF